MSDLLSLTARRFFTVLSAVVLLFALSGCVGGPQGEPVTSSILRAQAELIDGDIAIRLANPLDEAVTIAWPPPMLVIGTKANGAATTRTPYNGRGTLVIEPGNNVLKTWPVDPDMTQDLTSMAIFIDADVADAIGWLALQIGVRPDAAQ